MHTKVASYIIAMTVYLIFLFSSEINSSQIKIIIGKKNSSNSIDFYLCQNGLKSGVTLILLPSINYTVSFSKFCVIQNVTDVTIMSNNQVFILCNSTETGFGFFNSTNVHLENLTFIGCGGEIQLPTNVELHANKSNVYIAPKQKAVLLFTHCYNTQLLSIVITGSFKGIGMLLINEHGNATTIREVSVSNKFTCQNALISLSDFSCAGSGIVFVYIDTNLTLNIENIQLSVSHLSVTQSTQLFSTNMLNLFSRGYSIAPIVSAAGLTLIIASNKHIMNISLHRINIFENYNSHIGAMLVVYHRIFLNHYITLSKLNFTENHLHSISGDEASESAGLTFLVSAHNESDNFSNKNFPSAVNITDSVFTSNQCHRGGAMLFISQPYSYVNMDFALVNCTFIHNEAKYSGSGMYIEMSQTSYSFANHLNLHLSKIIARLNNVFKPSKRVYKYQYLFDKPVFSFINVQSITVKDCCILANQGSAIQVYNGVLKIENDFLCENNTSLNGGCLILKGLSYLHLTKTTNATFKGNRALVSGGAIYGDTMGVHTDVCTIQPYTGTSLHKYPLVFENNHAHLDGDDIKIANIYDCTLMFNKAFQTLLLKKDFNFYKKLFLLQENNSQSISGKENKINLCNSQKHQISLFSGQTVVLQVSVVDREQNPVSAQILTTVSTFGDKDSIQLASEVYHSVYPIKCNLLNFTVTVTTNINKRFSGELVLQSTINPKPFVKIDIEMLPCPIGFHISEQEGHICACSSFLRNLQLNIVCEIDKAVIHLPETSWFGTGTVYNSTEAYSSICPPDYCYVNRASSYDSTVLDPLCKYNRTGIMCGQCQAGLSQVFGSYECMECSNLWLLTIPMYLIIGLAIVLLLFYTKLTIASGSLGGIIFFANLSTVSLHIEILNKTYYTIPVRIAMGALNLNMGYPVCFYNGMNSITKTAMQFAFPVYLWLIVFVLVVISRYSTRLSNLIVGSSVQVLVTLIHLSFAKILLTVSDIFTSENLLVSNNASMRHIVWYFDGNELFFSGQHLLLFCASLVMLVVFILPYLSFTTVACRIGRCYCINHRLSLLIDAFCGPYKSKYRYWFGVRVWIVTLLYISYAALRGIHPQVILILNIVATFLFLSIQIYVKPFTSKINNITDSMFIYLLCVTDIITYFFIMDKNIESSQCSIVVTLLLLVYLVMVFTIFTCFLLMTSKKTSKLILIVFNYVKSRQLMELKETSKTSRDDDTVHQRLLYRYEAAGPEGESSEKD